MSLRSRRALAGILLLAAFAWLPLNQRIEGPVLIVLTPDHGVTTADLLSVGLVIAAAVIAFPRRRSSR